MVTITFPDRDTEKRALGFLLGRFSGQVLRSGEHLVPEAALEALADQNIPFTVTETRPDDLPAAALGQLVDELFRSYDADAAMRPGSSGEYNEIHRPH